MNDLANADDLAHETAQVQEQMVANIIKETATKGRRSITLKKVVMTPTIIEQLTQKKYKVKKNLIWSSNHCSAELESPTYTISW